MQNKLKWKVVVGWTVIIALAGLIGVMYILDKKELAEEQKFTTHPTTLVVKNDHPTDTVLVYLTLGKKKGFKANVNGIFGIKDDTDHLQGSFYIAPKDSVVYADPKGVPIQGNITFWEKPNNCVNVNLFEFCLSNEYTIKNAQETVDISCMGGVNVLGSITMTGGGAWTDNYKNPNVTEIKNKEKYHNNNISGVYPLGCPYCINHIKKPVCVEKPSPPNAHNICQVQRNSTESGGIVTITYIDKVE
jgi:hypothetical protein